MRKMLILLLGIAAFFGGIQGLKINASTPTSNVTYELDGGYFEKTLHSVLNRAQNETLLLQGDSTGNGTDEWFYLTVDQLKGVYTHSSFLYYLWSDSKQTYSSPTRLSTGSDGKAFATFPGTINNGVIVDNSQSLHLSDNDFEIIAQINPDNWTDTQVIASKFGAGGQREWAFYINAGKLYLMYTVDGSTALFANSGLTVSATEGEPIWVKLSVDADNGSSQHVLTFQKSTDGTTFTNIDTPTVKEGTLSIFESTTKVEIGARGTLGTEFFKGDIYEVIINIGSSDKTTLMHLDFGNTPNADGKFYDPYGNIFGVYGSLTYEGSKNINILNASVSGAAISYSKDETKFAKQTPMPLTASFISYSHNEGLNVDYTASYLELVNMIKAKYSTAMIFAVTQNQQKSPSTVEAIAAHATRNDQIKTLASVSNIGLIDGYDAVTLANVNEDGIHLTPEGSTQWKDEAISAINTYKFKVYSISDDVETGTIAPYHGVPKKTGYTFIGFYTDALFTTAFSPIMTSITEDTTLYAKWTPTTSGGSGSVIIDNASSFTTIDYLLMAGGVLLVIIIATSNKGKKKGKWS